MNPRIWTMRLATSQNWRADYLHHFHMVISTRYQTTTMPNMASDLKLIGGSIRTRPLQYRTIYKLTANQMTYTVSLTIQGKAVEVMVMETKERATENRLLGMRSIQPQTPLEVIELAERIIREDKGDAQPPEPPAPVADPQLVHASTKIATLPQGWDKSYQWAEHARKTLPFVFPEIDRSPWSSPYHTGPDARIYGMGQRIEHYFKEMQFFASAHSALYAIRIQYIQTKPEDNSTLEQPYHHIGVYRKCTPRERFNVVKVEKVVGEIFEALQKSKDLIESDKGCRSSDPREGHLPMPTPGEEIPVERAPARTPQLVSAWSYNYLTKQAHSSQDCELVGIIRQVKHEHIQLMKQDTTFTCGPAAVQNLLRLMHVEVPAEADLARAMRCTEDTGSDPEQIAAYLERINVPFRKFRAGIDNLDRILAANYVLLVEYQDYQDTHPVQDVVQDTASHFALLVGYDKGYYYLIDPYHPIDADKQSPLTKREKEKFLADWKARSFDGTHILENWGLAVKMGRV